jgi:hypothetical protein
MLQEKLCDLFSDGTRPVQKLQVSTLELLLETGWGRGKTYSKCSLYAGFIYGNASVTAVVRDIINSISSSFK